MHKYRTWMGACIVSSPVRRSNFWLEKCPIYIIAANGTNFTVSYKLQGVYINETDKMCSIVGSVEYMLVNTCLLTLIINNTSILYPFLCHVFFFFRLLYIFLQLFLFLPLLACHYLLSSVLLFILD